MRVNRITAIAAGTAALGASLAIGAGSAAAITPWSGTGYVGATLTHDETVLADQLRAGALINVAFGDNWRVRLPHDSIWHTGGWTPVTGEQFVAEAASHPNGQIGVWLQDSGMYGEPFLAESIW
ncbi:hypothetical protein [Tomitella biformata]|uniref:hypothetical protein n=1 Tax=Tomitella biformata TaxID=630403 RepID=UPI0004635D06|nr:hypothetical protein [Tomitella biformata]